MDKNENTATQNPSSKDDFSSKSNSKTAVNIDIFTEVQEKKSANGSDNAVLSSCKKSLETLSELVVFPAVSRSKK